MSPTPYQHTQVGRIHWLVAAIGVVEVALGLLAETPSYVAMLLLVIGTSFLVLAVSFRQLTVREAGDRLELRFGPLPLFRRTVAYAAITSFEVSRSRWIDGLGIHRIPGRGWTWNLWGFDCVELQTLRGPLRIGTDDPRGLAAHLEERVSGAPPA